MGLFNDRDNVFRLGIVSIAVCAVGAVVVVVSAIVSPPKQVGFINNLWLIVGLGITVIGLFGILTVLSCLQHLAIFGTPEEFKESVRQYLEENPPE